MGVGESNKSLYYKKTCSDRLYFGFYNKMFLIISFWIFPYAVNKPYALCVYDIFLIVVSSSFRMTVLDCKRSIIRKGSIFIPSQELCTENGMPTEQFSTLQYFLIWHKRQITWIICVGFLHIDVHWNRNWVILLATVQIKFFYVWLLNFYWIEKFM